MPIHTMRDVPSLKSSRDAPQGPQENHSDILNSSLLPELGSRIRVVHDATSPANRKCRMRTGGLDDYARDFPKRRTSCARLRCCMPRSARIVPLRLDCRWTDRRYPGLGCDPRSTSPPGPKRRCRPDATDNVFAFGRGEPKSTSQGNLEVARPPRSMA